MRLPPFPSIKKGLSFGEVNPLLGHSIYHSSNQYLTYLFSQVFNHTIIVHFGMGGRRREREKGVFYLCMVFFAIYLYQFYIFQCLCIFRDPYSLEGNTKFSRIKHPTHLQGEGGENATKTFGCIKNKIN